MSVNVKENGNLTKVGGLYIPAQFPHDSTKADQDSIANVENDTTASQAYSVGEFFYRNGDFCVVKADIASGATLTENTNYIVTNIADYLGVHVENVSCLQTWISYSGTHGQAKRTGNVVNVTLRVSIASMPVLTEATNLIELPWATYADPCFWVVHKNIYADGYPLETQQLYSNANSKYIRMAAGAQLANGSYYIQGTYITNDPI